MTDRARGFLAAYNHDPVRAIEFLLSEQDALREVIRESLEFHRDANAAFAAVINENGEKRDFIPAVRDLQRALWCALDGKEVVVRDNTPRAVEWQKTDDGGRLVRRARMEN